MGLFEPAWRLGNEKKALKAVEKESDQAKLFEIAEKAVLSIVRISAVERLDDQELLASLAKSDEDWSVRSKVVKKLTDQSVLYGIAVDDEDFRVCKVAVDRLTGQTHLSDIIKRHKSHNVRIAATKNLTDQTILADIATNERFSSADGLLGKGMGDEYPDQVGKFAVHRLTEQPLLLDVAENAVEWRVRLEAAKRVTDQTLVQRVYADIVLGGTDSGFEKPEIRAKRNEAFDRIADQYILANIAKASGNHTFNRGNSAVSRLTDRAIIADVAQTAIHESVRARAERRLAELAGGIVS